MKGPRFEKVPAHVLVTTGDLLDDVSRETEKLVGDCPFPALVAMIDALRSADEDACERAFVKMDPAFQAMVMLALGWAKS